MSEIASSEIERLHDLLNESIRSLGDALEIVRFLEIQADSRSLAEHQLGLAIGTILYASTFLPSHPSRKPELPQPDRPLTGEEQARVDQLTDEELAKIDEAIMANATTRLRKVAMIVGLAMISNTSASITNVPEVFYAQRVKKLVDAGLLEAEGKLSYMRFSEVKLPG